MKSNAFLPHLHLLLLISAAILWPLSASDSSEGREEDLESCTAEFNAYQENSVLSLKQIFDERQMCVPSQRFEDKVKIELLEKRSKYFIPGTTK